VKFTERTQDGSLRHPVYLGLRVDKTVEEVTMPDPEKIIENHDINKDMGATEAITDVNKSGDFDLKVGKITLHLTNQNKIYFPDDGITKGDIVNYYNEIAEVILPYLRNRPQSLNRFPNGINGASFFQKDFEGKKIPSWLKTTRVMSESSDDYIDYLLCNDKATLLYMANLGCIEINPWNSTIKNPENPDWMVIDLDPVKVEFRKIAETAGEIRKILESIEVESYCKTSGSKGLHIYIPLAARYDYETVKIFAKFIATTLHQQIPVITSIERAVSKRQNKIYLDYLQNNRSQTLAAPYSVRPRPGATVSAPLEWSEVNSSLTLDQFTIKTMMKRIDKKGDLWQPVLGKGVNLNKLIKRLQE
jgi:bifunctional non-homologous end joining protein LigD